MDNDYKLLEIEHRHKNTNHKVGITLDIKQYEYLYNQYGKFSIDEADNNEIKLITE